METTKSQKTQGAFYPKWEKEKYWQKLIQCTADATRLTDDEISKLEQNLAGEILAATAFLSGCRNPERIVVTHFISLVASLRCREVYSLTTGESLMERLEPVWHFPGGNRDVIKAGMLLLEILSLNDHKNNPAEDNGNVKQNPLHLHPDYHSELERLETTWQQLPAPVKESFGILFNKSISTFFRV